MQAHRNDPSTFLLSATVDFPDDVNYGLYNHARLEEMLGLIKEMGARRVYWLYYGDIEPESYWAGNLIPLMEYGSETLRNIGEPLKAAVPIAHALGLEVYGVLKLHNTGVSDTYPAGAHPGNASQLTRIGGPLVRTSPFIERHPHTRIRRRPTALPPDLDTLPVTRIRLRKRDASPTRIARENLQIWTSPDNYRYQRREVDFSLAETVEPAPREVRDYFGELVTAAAAPVRTLTLDGLHLADSYILVTTDFQGEQGDFRNTALGMLEAYGPDGQRLPIVVATRTATVDCPRDFRSYGLEFDSGFGPLQFDLDADNASRREGVWWSRMLVGGAIAFARGKNEYLACAPCEIYPEVQQLWSGWVDRIIAAGVDGLDIRISAHATLTDEPHEYGFNDPILAAYREQFGAEPQDTNLDLQRLAKLRGAYITDFMRQTSGKLRHAGKKMQAHLHAEAFRPHPNHGQLMGFPANIDFDWRTWLKEGLLDGVTFRCSWFEALEDAIEGRVQRSRLAQALADPVAAEMLQWTADYHIPAYLNRYVDRAVGTDEYVADLESIYRDPRFSGFDVYEFAHLARSTPDGTRLMPVKDRIPRLTAKARELGI